MTRLDVSFLGRQPGLIVRSHRDIMRSRPRALTLRGWLVAGAITALIWAFIVLVFVL